METKFFHYTIQSLIQGVEESTLSIESESQELADNIVITAAKESRINDLIDDCESSESELDYATVSFLMPGQVGGKETVSIYRDKTCLYSNKIGVDGTVGDKDVYDNDADNLSDLEQIERKLCKNGGDWDLTNDEGVAFVIAFEGDHPIPELKLNQDGVPCAMIPLSFFNDDTIGWINENM